VLVGLPSGTFDTPIFEVVLKRITIRGSIVGTRQDMTEALDFAERGLVKCSVEVDKLENVNTVFEKLKNSKINGRVVIRFDE
jgi:propanol-preferring alcohol dehydrogenase